MARKDAPTPTPTPTPNPTPSTTWDPVPVVIQGGSGVEERLSPHPLEIAINDLTREVTRLVERVKELERGRGDRPPDPFPCPRCTCTRTPVRNGTHWSAKGVRKYRACAECGWTFATEIPHEGPSKGVQILA